METLRPKYFTPRDVSMHNTEDDLYVSFLGKVFDLTPLCEQYRGDILLKPIVTLAGKDISHWFNPRTKDIRYHTNPETGCRVPYCPNGRFVHVPPTCPDSTWSYDYIRPWWQDLVYMEGLLTRKTRNIKIINTLTSQENVIEVCSEETIDEILQRYLKFNSHAASYTWKYDGNILDMSKNLTENGIKDYDEGFYELRMDDSSFLQAIHIYFNDDLTEA